MWQQWGKWSLFLYFSLHLYPRNKMLYFQDNSWKSLKVAGDLAYHLVFILLVFLFSLVIVCAMLKDLFASVLKKDMAFKSEDLVNPCTLSIISNFFYFCYGVTKFITFFSMACKCLPVFFSPSSLPPFFLSLSPPNTSRNISLYANLSILYLWKTLTKGLDNHLPLTIPHLYF